MFVVCLCSSDRSAARRRESGGSAEAVARGAAAALGQLPSGGGGLPQDQQLQLRHQGLTLFVTFYLLVSCMLAFYVF